ncbi:hypothetical protein JHK82_049233 [Glycine max]|nr:hypothetical protein JHK86_049082 [Glycine max]KAG4934917.1 hypothetical protein JHK85_049836 [Glycine max]KAG5090455.1 hypothetical protein JHK82_049233 [Glycine max]
MEEEKSRLLLMPSPLQGHITPFLHLGDILYSKGFSITILHTIFKSPDPSSYPHFTLSETEASKLDRCRAPHRPHQHQMQAPFEGTVGFFGAVSLLRLVLRTGGASSFLVFASFPLLREKGYLPVQEPLVYLPPLKVKDLPKFQSQDPEECKASSGVIWNTFKELESSVYVSFGSIAAISKTEFLEIAWGLANSKQLFLWVIRPGLIHGSEWLEPLPNQKVNAKYASSVWKVGVQLQNKLERGEVEKTIKKLMVGDEANEIRENALNLKEKASDFLKEGGSSYCFLDSLVSDILSLKSATSRAH